MLRTVQLVLVTVSLLSTVHGQAPGDEDVERCVESPTYAHTYPNNWKVLMDSWNYEQLLPGHSGQPVAGAVWTDASCDNNDAAEFPFITPPYWQHGAGGICRWQAQVCGHSVGEQNNWLFTQHISKDVPANDSYTVRVFVNVTYAFQSCRTRNNCNPQLRVLTYLADDQEEVSTCNDTSLFSGSDIMPSNTFGSSTDGVVSDLLYFNMRPDENGLYLALQDFSTGDLRGTCVGINRLIVYRHECPTQAVELVRYPATQAPVSGTESVQTECVDNAISGNSMVTCDSDGNWGPETPSCTCEAGYEERTDSGQRVCQACSPGYFRSDEEDSCTRCPSNTESSPAAASICQCTDYHYRVDESNPYCGRENHPGCVEVEGAATGCTAAPSKPTNLAITPINGTAINITWDQPTDFGGRDRDDIFYRVLVQEVGSLDPPVTLTDRIRNTLNYTVSGLRPVTQYMIQVVAENGVSYHDNETHRVAARTAEVVDETEEGPPEVVSNPRVVDNIVIVWGPPEVPNGVITGYHLSLTFCPTGSSEGSAIDNGTLLVPDVCETRTSTLEPNTLFFVMREAIVPDYPNNVTCMVAGITGGDMIGVLSKPITFVPFAAPDIVVITDCPAPTSTTTCPTPTPTTPRPTDDTEESASVEDCIVNMAITAGAIFVITTIIMCLFSCIIACLCHKHKMKTFKINLKKEMHSKWEY